MPVYIAKKQHRFLKHQNLDHYHVAVKREEVCFTIVRVPGFCESKLTNFTHFESHQWIKQTEIDCMN